MNKCAIINKYLNDKNIISTNLKQLLTILSQNNEVIIFGGFLRECISRNNISSITNYLLNEEGDVDILIMNYNKNLILNNSNLHIQETTSAKYQHLLKRKIINSIKNKNKNLKDIRKLEENFQAIASHYQYNLIIQNNQTISVDILVTSNIKAFLNSNLDLSINSLYYNYNTTQLYSKNSNLISLDTIINHIKNKIFIVIQNTRFIQIITRIIKIFNRGYIPIYENIYTYNYIFSRISKILLNRNKLNNYISKKHHENLFDKLNSSIIYDLLKRFNNKCKLCSKKLYFENSICNNCSSEYYKYNSKLLPYIHLNNKLLYEFIIYAIKDLNYNLFNLINKLYNEYLYKNTNYNNRLKIIELLSKIKSIDFIKKTNLLNKLNYIDKCYLATNAIINSNLNVFSTVIKLISVHDIDYDKIQYENLLEFSFNYNCIDISKKIIFYSSNKITNSSDLFFKVCMYNNLDHIKLYLDNCNNIKYDIFCSDQIITNLINNIDFKIIQFLRDKFNFKFYNSNIQAYLDKYFITKNNNNYISYSINFKSYNELSYILVNSYNKIDIYFEKDWRYNPIPKLLLQKYNLNYYYLYYILVDCKISINKLMCYAFYSIQKIIINNVDNGDDNIMSLVHINNKVRYYLDYLFVSLVSYNNLKNHDLVQYIINYIKIE